MSAALDDLLPQQQCRRCGQPDCAAFAQALAGGRASINDCPPGGEVTRRALAARLGVALDPPTAIHGEAEAHVAVVEQADCIGCARCLQACPVDAIVGASLARHAVIVSHCTGCGLCLPVCPTDCIDLLPRPVTDPGQPVIARRRYHERNRRLAATAVVGPAPDALIELDELTPARLRDAVLEAVRRRRENGHSGGEP
ncbi:MAG: RnfABCDGE type electron transport complex subunit B [Gammaproteobacteria bacterium]